MKFLILHFQNASKYPPLLNFIFELNKVGINFICITTGKRVENNNQDLPYIGNGDKIVRSNLPFIGLVDGITLTYNKLLEAKNV